MTSEAIIKLLPYQSPFLFVDELIQITEKGIVGQYTFPVDSYFYEGHFKEHPVTPGVILTECMAQIGLVCFGIYLMRDKISDKPNFKFALTEQQSNYLLPVYPGEKVTVRSEKIYFRFGKLKCKVQMTNATGEKVCFGEIAGMLVQ